jgi:hypothetical protein
MDNECRNADSREMPQISLNGLAGVCEQVNNTGELLKFCKISQSDISVKDDTFIAKLTASHKLSQPGRYGVADGFT